MFLCTGQLLECAVLHLVVTKCSKYNLFFSLCKDVYHSLLGRQVKNWPLFILLYWTSMCKCVLLHLCDNQPDIINRKHCHLLENSLISVAETKSFHQSTHKFDPLSHHAWCTLWFNGCFVEMMMHKYPIYHCFYECLNSIYTDYLFSSIYAECEICSCENYRSI